MKQISRSSWSLVFIAAFLISTFCVSGLYRQNRIKIDAPSYYMYLPSIFIYKDISLNYTEKNSDFFNELTWYNKLPNGKKIIKHPMGISVLLLPFFLIGHAISYLTGFPQDGYSLPYQNVMSAGVLLYLMIGLHFLRKFLLNYFSEAVTALTLISVVIGTNLLWYVTYEGFMSHGISFSLICICIYFFFKWLEKGLRKYLIGFSITFGLIILIRSVLIILLFYFIVAAILKTGGIKKFLLFIKPQLFSLIICAVIIFLILFPQLLYYKYITDEWFFNSYCDEHFCFTQPEWYLFLFSFRKGWLIYTPLMWFSIVGLLSLYKIKRELFFATLVILLISIYLFSAWWCWSYAACFGMRVMVDLYGILCIPIACLFSFLLSKKKGYVISTYILTAVLIGLNLFQTWQFSNGLIHFDYMTKESYFKGFFQTKATTAWYDLLKPYDYEKRKQGLPQLEYSKQFFKNIKKEDLIYLRASCNLQFLSIDNPYSVLFCSDVLKSSEIFRVLNLTGDTIAIQSLNGKYLSLKENKKNVLIADKETITQNEKFVLHIMDEKDNRVALQAANGNFLSVIENRRNILSARSNEVLVSETFRFYILQQK